MIVKTPVSTDMTSCIARARGDAHLPLPLLPNKVTGTATGLCIRPCPVRLEKCVIHRHRFNLLISSSLL